MLKRVIDKLNQKKIVLASGSPRRQELFEKMGIKCVLCPSLFEENLKPEDFEQFSDYVEATALGKVIEVEKRLTDLGNPPDMVIGADTMVTLDGILYGKPKDEQDAFNTLKTLSGKPHTVYTGVVLKMGETIRKFTESTKVYIGDLSDEEIKAYVETGEPMDKAGSYGIQGTGSCIIEKIDGDYFTVMGLPIYRLNKELVKLLL